MFAVLALFIAICEVHGKAIDPRILIRDNGSPPSLLLHSPDFSLVVGKPKGSDDHGWGSFESNDWSFNFGSPANYTSEESNITLFDRRLGKNHLLYWIAAMDGAVPPVGTFSAECTISATATLTGDPAFTLLTASPWISPSAAGRATATCTPAPTAS